MTQGTDCGLPDFAFPVVAWAPRPATGDEGDDGIRIFAGPHALRLTYMPEIETRLGWTFVDSRGRTWEAVSAKVMGRAEAWPKRLLSGLIYDPEYRLAFVFAERPPMSFGGVRDRLLAAIDANPKHYGGGHGAARRKELLAAETLEEVAKPDWLKALEAQPPDPWWSAWFFWEGRASRLGFLGAVAAIILAWAAVIGIAPTTLAVLALVLLGGTSGLAATVRRLHDLSRSGWWVILLFPWSWLCASIYTLARHAGGPTVAAWLWWTPALCTFAWLALWPGTRGPNRYGFEPRRARNAAMSVSTVRQR